MELTSAGASAAVLGGGAKLSAAAQEKAALHLGALERWYGMAPIANNKLKAALEFR